MRAKNKGLNILRSWLESVGIHCSILHNYKSFILVKNIEDEDIRIYVTFSKEDFQNLKTIKINYKDIVNSDKSISLCTFHKLTDFLGFGFPKLTDRGIKSDKKETQDFDLMAIRITEFHKSCNPDNNVFSEYKKPIDIAINLFFRKNYFLCKTTGYEKEDLKSYAMIWLCNYLSLYRIINPQEDNEDQKKFYAYLKQRFYYFKKLLLRRVKNTNLSCEDYSLFRFGKVFHDPADAVTSQMAEI